MPLHSQAQAFLESIALQNAPGWSELSPDEGRRVFASLTDLFGTGPEVAQVEDHVLGDSVPTRVYRPFGAGPHAALIYLHGGGWVLGDLDTHDTLCRRLCHEASCVVVAVDYRRSPESRYPAALNDSVLAAETVAAESSSLSVDPHRLHIAGDSAGGSLALGVTRRIKANGGPAIRSQVLIYPVLQPIFETSSYRAFADGHGLTRQTMQWFWEQYRGECTEEDEFLCPATAADLTGLPPTHIITAEYDVLRDEGEQLGARLQAAQVPTTIRRYEGMVHGFIHFSGIFEVGDKALSDVADVLREAGGD